MVNGRNVFDKLIENDLKTYDNIQKIATGKGDDFITGYLLDYLYFKEYYKLIAMYLRKTIQQINFIENRDGDGNRTIFLTVEEVKYFRFFTRNHESTVTVFCFNIILV